MSPNLTDHPPPDQLQAYGQGLLSRDASAAVEKHLEACDACAGVLEGAPAGEFLERVRAVRAPAGGPAANGPASTGDHWPRAAEVGAVVAGRYKLLQEIGEGGMGTVFMAEQTAPVKRMVALKVVRAGMDSRQVVARFEAERQALALMDHPNIAKVLDAGETDGGHPFFVMELVKGVPLTQFCDERSLSVEDRLAVFQQVCQAVQHAHQKGIIHRDLKPTNILVESHDGKPVPKVIDFGLAKALNALPLTDRSLFTHFGAVLGTPMYMAPEQAEFGALDIDTRADIYALGVLLYELLTGTTPLQKERLAAAAWEEICRVIKEEEPQTPSARLSTAEGRAGVAARRQSEPARLNRFVRGDLDWIVMKALAKERDRRYPTANALAADLGRFLSHEPVSAGPPTMRYKVRKFVRRHRGPVVATAVVGLALAAGAVGTIWGLVDAAEARRQEQIAKDQREAADREHAARLQEEQERARREAVSAALEKGLLAALSADFAAAEAAADAALRAGAAPGDVWMLQGLIAFSRGDTAQAVRHLERAAESLPTSIPVRGMLAYIYGNAGEAAKFQAMLDQLAPLRPAAPVDFLFKGLGESTLDPARGVGTLDAAFVRDHPSVVVRLVQAEARSSYLVQVDPDPKEAERATTDAQFVRTGLRGNPAAHRTSLRAHLIAMGVYRAAGHQEQYQAARGRADEDFNALSKFRHQPDVAQVRYYFLREVGRSAEALEDSRFAFRTSPDPTTAYNHAQALYLSGEYAQADKVLKDVGGRPLDWVRLLAVAETEGRDGAYRLYREMTDGKDLSAWDVYNGILVLYFLGKGAEAQTRAGDFLRHEDQFPVLRRDQFRTAVEFLAGHPNEDDFLRGRRTNLGDRCNAHLSVGLKYFSEGDFRRARTEFEHARRLWVIDFVPYDMSYLLLERMKKVEQDRKQWPGWIDPKEPAGPDGKKP